MNYKSIISILLFFLLFSFSSYGKITIFTIGDSTMANKSLEGDNQERGWGQMLPGFFSCEVEIENHAKNGRSSKSFIDEGLWDIVLKKIKPGDYVFIQFGHNDEKQNIDRHTDPGTTFDANLENFAKETIEKGGFPVLFNSIVRRNFVNGDSITKSDNYKEKDNIINNQIEGEKLIDTHGKYLISPRDVARKMDIPFIDLNSSTHNLVQGMGAEKSKKIYMWIEENRYAFAPKGKKDNTHLNVYGARKVASLAIDEITKKIPELAKYVKHYDFVVSKDGCGDFFTIQDAINAVPDFRKSNRTTILVKKSVYDEKVVIPASKLGVSLIGEEGTVITHNDYASKNNIFGEEMSTSGSSTCYIYPPDFYAENITFENSAGRVGQAVACFVDGDRAYFKNCRFLGNQDTLYTYGKDSRQYYDNCYIEGTVDFIFGWSTALFMNCIIKSIGNGYITAPATDKGKLYGYVFINCSMIGGRDVENVFLSRPWRPYAKAVFINCNMDKHISPLGWNNWDKKDAEKNVFYAEYHSYGEGANMDKRAKFGKQLKIVDNYSPETILAGNDGWDPYKNGNSLIKDIKR